jgi:hypothetical protein
VKNQIRFFYSSFIVTLIGLIAGFVIGYIYSGTWQGAFSALLLTFILAILEISLSFDNAVVNASILREMAPKWRHRFITWGMLIAVFGMRIVFPLLVVSLVAHISPWHAIVLASTKPHDYATIMTSAQLPLAGFGGAFLLMVALTYFLNHKKEVHWIGAIETQLVKLGKIEAVELGLCLVLFYFLSRWIPDAEARLTFLTSGIAGLLTYIAVDGISALIRHPDSSHRGSLEAASMALFLYLEILDASFSFDGVIGAFALTNNLFIIAAGLGIGAMFVRSLTILLVEKGTLEHFRYLEHGAFYAIGALGMMMLLDVFVHVPEVATGLIGGAILILSLISSLRRPKGQAQRID